MNTFLKVAQIGTGCVGGAVALGLRAWGHHVVCCDVCEERLVELQKDGFEAVLPQDLPVDCGLIFISVPTPTPAQTGQIDLSYLENVFENLATWLPSSTAEYPVIVQRCTTPPGTTERLAAGLEEVTGLRRGKDFGLLMHPEYLTENNAASDFQKPHVVVIGGDDPRALSKLKKVYQSLEMSCPVYTLETTAEAEAAKYLHNVLGAFRIGFFNEMRALLLASHANPATVFNVTVATELARKDPGYGTRDMGPFSGMCLPKDTRSLQGWAHQLGILTPQLDAVIKFNDALSGVTITTRAPFVVNGNNGH
jgi:UDPglucose 6-dehydrogenase